MRHSSGRALVGGQENAFAQPTVRHLERDEQPPLDLGEVQRGREQLACTALADAAAAPEGPVSGLPIAISVDGPPRSTTATNRADGCAVPTAPANASRASSSGQSTYTRSRAARSIAATSSSLFAAWRPGAVTTTSRERARADRAGPRPERSHGVSRGRGLGVGDAVAAMAAFIRAPAGVEPGR